MASARRFLAPLILKVKSWANVDRVLSNLDDRIRQIVKVPVLDGVLISDQDIPTAGVDIIHGLGRTPRGAIVVRASAGSRYTMDSFGATSFTVTASTASTVDLWVF